MVWKSDQRAKESGLVRDALVAYRAGYSDGFHKYPKWSGHGRHEPYSISYSEGYNDGVVDTDKN